MSYFPSIFIVVKMLVFLHVCCQTLVHAKRKERKSPKEASISSEKSMGWGSWRNRLFLTKQ